jgi:hypothetical protein
MTYNKPEVTVLGDAANLIQGSKQQQGDAGSLTVQLRIADCELDD